MNKHDVKCYDYFYMVLGVLYFIPSVTILLYAWEDICPTDFKPWIISMLITYFILLVIRTLKYYKQNNYTIGSYVCYISWMFCYLGNIIAIVKKCDNYMDIYNYCIIVLNSLFLLIFIIEKINERKEYEIDNMSDYKLNTDSETSPV